MRVSVRYRVHAFQPEFLEKYINEAGGRKVHKVDTYGYGCSIRWPRRTSEIQSRDRQREGGPGNKRTAQYHAFGDVLLSHLARDQQRAKYQRHVR